MEGFLRLLALGWSARVAEERGRKGRSDRAWVDGRWAGYGGIEEWKTGTGVVSE